MPPGRFSRQIACLRTEEKLTQARYGSSTPAPGATRQKDNMVARIKRHRAATSTNAQPGLCSPENSQDQTKFSASCTTYSSSAGATTAVPARRHTSHAAIAIKVYSTPHTGPKIQFGGLKDGFCS